MASLPPVGEPVPPGGPLPADTARSAGPGSHLGLYLHVPFCATRCGYCDFNTYTAGELGAATGPDAFVAAALAEIRLARATLAQAPPVRTVFVGGGTPTLLPAADLARLLAEVRASFGLAPGAEVSIEANPETVTPALAEALLTAGYNRISLGMQSAAPHVLATLDRTHTPGRAVAAAGEALRAGFPQVSLDLIYGTPGESAADWQASLQAALTAGPTHLSAYALVVEDGTALARQVASGRLPAPDSDVLADRYELADELLSAAGLRWYEVSNWGAPCQHNLGYWRGANWWGIGPGAHSHVGGVRWWNVRHPARYAARLAAHASPAQGRELLSPTEQTEERVLLGVRLAEGLPVEAVPAPAAIAALVADGLLVDRPDRVVLTRRGRLLADAVVRALLG